MTMPFASTRRTILAGLASLPLVTSGAAATPNVPRYERMPGRPVLDLGKFDLGELGYEVEEYLLQGVATGFRHDRPPTSDGIWPVSPGSSAPFATRIVVVRPRDPARINGTVLVEWLNVSGGFDFGPEWVYLHREVLRAGYVYAAVSAQRVGIEGGPPIGVPGNLPLKQADPARYQHLAHPGDDFAFDIFSQAGRTLRDQAFPDARLLAAGESQSAIFLATYINAIDPAAKVYNGYLVHSRFAAAPSVERPLIFVPKSTQPDIVRIRSDVRVPVLTLETETDVFEFGGPFKPFAAARQADHDRLRTWELAGTAHGDNYWNVFPIDSGKTPIEKLAMAWRPATEVFGQPVRRPINAAPQHRYVACAALDALDRWIKDDVTPARAAPLSTDDLRQPRPVLDAHGNATGGVRTPWMDVPTAILSGIGNEPGLGGALFGITEHFDKVKLRALYPGGRQKYLSSFGLSLDAAIAGGFILAADRSEALALAEVMWRGDARR